MNNPRVYMVMALLGSIFLIAGCSTTYYTVWGQEIYFDIPLQAELEPDAREEVQVGDLGYWPAGPAFCIFFGPTPVSRSDQPRAYSPVNVFGRVLGDTGQFKSVASGSTISITRVDE